MLTKFLTLCFLVLSTICNAQTKGWTSLFNGKDLKDWKVKINGHPLNDNYANTFRVENRAMKVS